MSNVTCSQKLTVSHLAKVENLKFKKVAHDKCGIQFHHFLGIGGKK